MNFESSNGETETRSHGGPDDGRSEATRSQDNSIWGMKQMREKVKDFVEGVKEKAPKDAVRNITEVAGQAKDYVENTNMRGMANDLTGLIKRYPIQSMILGMTVGFLVSRKTGD